jgi:rhamnulokinase
MASKSYLAVDLGASSGRVLAGKFDGATLELSELRRFDNGPVAVGPRLYWRTFQLWADILSGLREAHSKLRGSEIVSVGVDTWGVDFGLLDAQGELLGAPVAYRDARTQGMFDEAFSRVSREEIFAATGLQFMELNTLYQLLAAQHMGSPPLDRAARLLMMPDLFHWMLTGEASNEATNASTTQLLDPRTGDWAWDLVDRLGLPRHILGPIVPPGTRLGGLLPQVERETGLSGVGVVLPGTHDTASAVLAAPAQQATGGAPDWCYISSGTWSLMGVELPQPLITLDALAANFTNEGGVGGSTRLLKNISGLWLVQECRRQWARQGHTLDWDELTRLAAAAPALAAAFDAGDARLTAPQDMPATIAELCVERGFAAPTAPGPVIRAALESLALTYRATLGRLERLIGRRLSTIHIVGGGVQNRLLCQMTADACEREVLAGPIEATALGNVAMQAIAAGDVASVAEARQVIAASCAVERFEPQPDERWAAAAARLA